MKRCCLLASLMSIILPSLAGTIYVSGGGNALQKAIDKAKAGDILFVEPGTYSAIDTQGKEIEIRSTKGPKQTFLTCGKFKKPWAKILKDGVWFAALLVSDEDTDIWWSEDSEDEHFGLGVEWRDWTPMDIVKSRSTLVGFTITSGGAKIPSVADTSGFAVNGGRVFNCIFEGMDETSGCKSMGYVHAAEVCNCLLVARDIGSEIVCDCSVRNCTVVVDSYVGPWDSPVVCCELLNTILWFGQQYEIDNGSSRPRFENVVCRNVKWEEDVDPMFADIKNGDYALAVDSPCIDAGNNAYSAYDCDLNGGARIVNGTVDIGAYEYGSTPLYEEPEGLESFYGPFVPGEKVALTIPALVGYTAKGLPSGLKLNKKTGEIAGAAKKPTGEAGVTVTFTKKNGPTLTAQFVVGPIPTISVTLEGDTEKCKVTGSGDHLVGKKVSLQAKSPKGTAFVGGFRDGEPWPSVEESKKTKLSYVMTKESVSLVATFEKEKMRVACPALASASFTVGVAGAAAGIPIEIETQSGVKSVAVSKLPSGMKYDKKTGLIVGAPTKAGTFNVTIKVTAKSGAVEAITVPIIVASLPDWATGTFGGMIGRFIGPIDDDEFLPYGMITMKITAAGKISAKVTAGGKTYSFSAKGFDFVDEDGDYHFQMATKKGEVYEGEISAAYHDVAKLVQVEGADDPEGSFTIAGREPYFAIVWRNEHGKDGRLSVDPTGKAQKVMDAIKDFKTVELAQFDPAYGSVVLKIDAKGTTKLSGETADGVKISGTSFLMLDDDWYHVISDMVFYDKQSGNVYDVTLCFQPVFDGSGNVVDWDWKCCDHSLRVYPFE